MTKPFSALLKKSNSNLDAARELLKSSHYDASDYDFDQETTREEAARQIGRAEKFIQHVEMNFKSQNV